MIFFFILIELVYKDHGESYQSHGLLNFEGLILLLLIEEILLLIIILYIYLLAIIKY